MNKFRIEFLVFATCVLAAAAGLAQPNSPSGWKGLAEGGAEVELVPDPNPPVPDGRGTNSLRLTVNQMGTRFGIVCADMRKTELQAGQWYDLSFNARTEARKTFALTVSLESPDGKTVAARTTLPEVGGSRLDALHGRASRSPDRFPLPHGDRAGGHGFPLVE